MNIVITSASDIKLTQYESSTTYRIEDIKVYSNTEITSINAIYQDIGATYEMTLESTGKKLGDDFAQYTLNPKVNMPAGNYIFAIDNAATSVVKLQEYTANSGDNETGLRDEHDVLIVKDRTINVVASQVTLVAEDHYSQQVRFKIKKKFDNIDFLDDTKIVSVDYIPANFEMVKKDYQEEINGSGDITFLSDSENTGHVSREVSVDSDYIIIRWDVPHTATRYAGSLKVALCIENANQDDNYIWQTNVASLTVAPNIGLRDNKGSVSIIVKDSLQEQIDELDIRVTDLDGQVNNINSRVEDIETIFEGGTEVTITSEEEA